MTSHQCLPCLSQFEEATGSYVDPTLPIANQLEMAIVKLKEHIKTVVITRAEAKRLKAVSGNLGIFF